MAIQGAEYLTARNPGAVVVVRNVDSDTPIAVEALMQWLRTVAGSVKSQLWAANSQRRSISR
jgi:hypothetical protein